MEIHVIYNAEVLFKTNNTAILACDEILTFAKGVQKKKTIRWVHEKLVEFYLDNGQPDMPVKEEEEELTMSTIEALNYMRKISEEDNA
jgi:hypothetical protein